MFNFFLHTCDDPFLTSSLVKFSPDRSMSVSFENLLRFVHDSFYLIHSLFKFIFLSMTSISVDKYCCLPFPFLWPLHPQFLSEIYPEIHWTAEHIPAAMRRWSIQNGIPGIPTMSSLALQACPLYFPVMSHSSWKPGEEMFYISSSLLFVSLLLYIYNISSSASLDLSFIPGIKLGKLG